VRRLAVAVLARQDELELRVNLGGGGLGRGVVGGTVLRLRRERQPGAVLGAIRKTTIVPVM
jgi:hypothetical protein